MHLKRLLVLSASLFLLGGCCRMTIKTPSGYSVTYTRAGIIPRQYELRDFKVSATNLTVEVGCASIAVNSNSVSAVDALGGVAAKITKSAVEGAVSAASPVK